MTDWNAGQPRFTVDGTRSRTSGTPCRDGRSRAARKQRQVMRGLLDELALNAITDLPQSDRAAITGLIMATMEADAVMQARLDGAPIAEDAVVRSANAMARATECFKALKVSRANAKPGDAMAKILAEIDAARAKPAADAPGAKVSA